MTLNSILNFQTLERNRNRNQGVGDGQWNRSVRPMLLNPDRLLRILCLLLFLTSEGAPCCFRQGIRPLTCVRK